MPFATIRCVSDISTHTQLVSPSLAACGGDFPIEQAVVPIHVTLCRNSVSGDPVRSRTALLTSLTLIQALLQGPGHHGDLCSARLARTASS
jgi:hypothetical protein